MRRASSFASGPSWLTTAVSGAGLLASAEKTVTENQTNQTSRNLRLAPAGSTLRSEVTHISQLPTKKTGTI